MVLRVNSIGWDAKCSEPTAGFLSLYSIHKVNGIVKICDESERRSPQRSPLLVGARASIRTTRLSDQTELPLLDASACSLAIIVNLDAASYTAAPSIPPQIRFLLRR